MGYGILWLSHLAFTFFLIAATCAWASRRENPRWPRGWPLFVSLLSLASVAVYAVFGAILISANVQPKWLFWYGLSLTVVFLAGAFLILKRGLKDIAAENPGARSWPRWKLLTATAVFLFIYVMALNAIETRIMIRSTNDYIKASANLHILLPVELPDTLNARPLYDQAVRLLESKSDAYDWLNNSEKADFDVTSDKVTTALADHQDALLLMERAVERPGYSLNAGGANYYSWPIPNYLPYRNLSRLLNLSARRHALEGNLNAALKDLAMIDKIANHLFQYPTLISFMIAGAIDKNRIAGLEHVLANTDRLISQNIRFPLRMPSTLFPEFKRSILVESIGSLEGLFFTVTSSESYRGMFSLTETQPVFLLDPTATILWRVFLLPSDLEAAKKMAKLMSQDASSYEDIQNNLKKIGEAYEAGELGIFTAIATPNYSTYSQRAKQVDARRSLAATALAATAYQNSTGTYPVKLEDLVPNYLDKVPTDPFAPKQSVQMKVVNGGLVLFSKGPTLKAGSSEREPIHFYLGQKAYEELRIKIAGKER
ncbi:MAG: hypothetical protein JRJ41_01030 [Deltaproteobacteria bacterium]|nr:hypothetical protein [Deltaproteobacteria bacterium]